MLTADRLSFRFPLKVIFEDLSFQIGPGQALLVEGSNGAGKSTLLEVLAGFRTPASGTVSFRRGGVEVPRLGGMVAYLGAEQNGLYLGMDALSNLRYGLALREVELPPDELASGLAQWGFGPAVVHGGVPVRLFSTGMKRRLALLRLFLAGPALLLLDEPLANLDRDGGELVREALMALLDRGGMAVVVSHQREPLAAAMTRSLKL